MTPLLLRPPATMKPSSSIAASLCRAPKTNKNGALPARIDSLAWTASSANPRHPAASAPGLSFPPWRGAPPHVARQARRAPSLSPPWPGLPASATSGAACPCGTHRARLLRASHSGRKDAEAPTEQTTSAVSSQPIASSAQMKPSIAASQLFMSL